MVQSIVNKRLNYPETTAINPQDINKELTAYDTTLYGIPVSVCLGNVQNTYSSYNVLWVPAYLVKPNGKVTPIGLYEFSISKYKFLKDEEGDLDFYKLSRPLLYSFATVDYVSTIVHGLEKHKLEIDAKLLTTLKEKERKTEEYERILKEEMEMKKTQSIVSRLREQHDFSISSAPQQIYSRNKSRKNRKFDS